MDIKERIAEVDDLIARLTYDAPANGDSDRFEAARELDRLRRELAEARLDAEHLQRAVVRACATFNDVLTQDLDGTTQARVELFLAAYEHPAIDAAMAEPKEVPK